jgi:NAD(P)-dependent dehydrogenase (short-subunit alcohol dehydrogenase family)
MSKVWLITGSSRGLGRAFAEFLLENGHKVVATARKVNDLAELKEHYGDSVLTLGLDVTSEAQAGEAVSSAIERWGTLDVLVNNAGYSNMAPVEDTSLQEFRDQIETNLFGAIIMTKAVIPYFRERRAGVIQQISSIGARGGPAGRAPYAAAKAGLEGFSISLSREVGPLGIKVIIVEPGGFRTDFAGVSTILRAGRPEYAGTVGAAAKFQEEYNGRQPGDPRKAAEVLIRLAEMESPPIRITLGTDAYEAAEKTDAANLELAKKFKDYSCSTDF